MTTHTESHRPVLLSARRASARWRWLSPVAAGLAVGVLTSFGQTVLSGAGNAFVNSASAWLVVPLLVGMLFDRARSAAWAGLVCCLLQLIGYDITAVLRGFSVSTSVEAFWGVCALLGGPLFGVAGHLWRFGPAPRRGLGPAALAAAFIAEGAWNYVHTLHYAASGALWIGIGAAIALAGLRGRRGWRWLALTLPLGLLAEIALTQILR
jgi:Family of unknown function (DUF6518)